MDEGAKRLLTDLEAAADAAQRINPIRSPQTFDACLMMYADLALEAIEGYGSMLALYRAAGAEIPEEDEEGLETLRAEVGPPAPRTDVVGSTVTPRLGHDPEFQVLGPVVIPDAVAMVDRLTRLEGTTQLPFHDEAVFMDHPAFVPDSDVAVAVRVAVTLAPSSRRARGNQAQMLGAVPHIGRGAIQASGPPYLPGLGTFGPGADALPGIGLLNHSNAILHQGCP